MKTVIKSLKKATQDTTDMTIEILKLNTECLHLFK